MNILYAITATVTRRIGDATLTRNLPTFFLDPNVQGILNLAHAESVGRDILTSGGRCGEVSVSAFPVARDPRDIPNTPTNDVGDHVDGWMRDWYNATRPQGHEEG